MENGKLLDTAGAVLSTYVNIEKKLGGKGKKEMLKWHNLKQKKTCLVAHSKRLIY
jgi:hypothetical protein